jgi:hypothetical protein
MKRYFVALAAACALMLTLAAGPALAGGLLPTLPAVGQTVSNVTNQSNEATAVNVPIVSGNNVALVNGGDQTASAGTTQEQSNQNATYQDADQSTQGSSADRSSGPCGCSEESGSQDQSVSNETNQSNEATAVNVPIASGNNVALVNGGDQTASAGTTQEQSNRNATKQEADQSGSGSYGKGGQEQEVSNQTDQSNEATAVNVPIASGNNVALFNGGDQTASAGTTQKQENRNYTRQNADQDTRTWSDNRDEGKQGSYDRHESKPCPKPEPKPCPEPKPKPCEPKPCQTVEPKPCKPKPCDRGSNERVRTGVSGSGPILS